MVSPTLETAPVLERSSPEGVKASFESVSSEKHPERNEDAVLSDREHGVFGVFDGVGGHAGGEMAASLAAAVIREGLKGEPTPSSVETAILQANKAVLEKSKEDPRLKGMATTASVVKVWQTPEGERKAYIGNVGDSRVYLYRGRELRQLTLDDNLFLATEARTLEEARILQGRLNRVTNEEDARRMGFTDRNHYYRRTSVITQALGSERAQIKPRTAWTGLQPGDRLLITSDGIHDNLTTAEMLGILSASPSVEALMRAAQDRSRQEEHIRHKKDDMSAVLIEIPS
jgi:protein phosphatase